MVCQNANLVLACSCGEKQAQIRVRPARSRDAASTTTLLQAPALSAVPCGGEHWPAGSGVWIYCHLVPKWVRERLSRESLARVSALIAAQRTFGELVEAERNFAATRVTRKRRESDPPALSFSPQKSGGFCTSPPWPG